MKSNLKKVASFIYHVISGLAWVIIGLISGFFLVLTPFFHHLVFSDYFPYIFIVCVVILFLWLLIKSAIKFKKYKIWHIFNIFLILIAVFVILLTLDSGRPKAQNAAAMGALAGVRPAAIVCLDDQGTLQYGGAGSNTPIAGSALCSEGDAEWPDLLPYDGWDYEAGATQDGQDFNFSATSDGGKGASGAERMSCSLNGCSTMTID